MNFIGILDFSSFEIKMRILRSMATFTDLGSLGKR